jgi:hypothetical protein
MKYICIEVQTKTPRLWVVADVSNERAALMWDGSMVSFSQTLTLVDDGSALLRNRHIPEFTDV